MRNRLFLLSFIAALLVAVPAASASGVSASGTCPQFRVLHNDHIGSVSFPAGPYNIVNSGMTCTQTTILFQQFLERPSGNLPKPWKLALLSGGRRRFTKVGTTVDFQATPVVEPSPSTLACPGTFAVLHNDHIGKMSLPKGSYTITRLSSSALSCTTASHDFAYFLNNDWAGNLPSPWTMNTSTKTFYRGSATDGFRVTKTASYSNALLGSTESLGVAG
jgi:hypothetical protein